MIYLKIKGLIILANLLLGRALKEQIMVDLKCFPREAITHIYACTCACVFNTFFPFRPKMVNLLLPPESSEKEIFKMKKKGKVPVWSGKCPEMSIEQPHLGIYKNNAITLPLPCLNDYVVVKRVHLHELSNMHRKDQVRL